MTDHARQIPAEERKLLSALRSLSRPMTMAEVEQQELLEQEKLEEEAAEALPNGSAAEGKVSMQHKLLASKTHKNLGAMGQPVGSWGF